MPRFLSKILSPPGEGTPPPYPSFFIKKIVWGFIRKELGRGLFSSQFEILRREYIINLFIF
jgi:hypothetical protein